jgi:hypothetical protein
LPGSTEEDREIDSLFPIMPNLFGYAALFAVTALLAVVVFMPGGKG